MITETCLEMLRVAMVLKGIVLVGLVIAVRTGKRFDLFMRPFDVKIQCCSAHPGVVAVGVGARERFDLFVNNVDVVIDLVKMVSGKVAILF